MAIQLKREIKTSGAILMGLGSIIGTGIFVSIAIATQIAGSGIIIAIIIAAFLATFNGLSSAQLAAAHPVSGGTYEYGYQFLGPSFGFTAGWMFLIAKSASAATAVLGCIGYLFYAFDLNPGSLATICAGIILLLAITLLVSGGIRRSNNANKIIVLFTLFGLFIIVITGIWEKGVSFEPIKNSFTDTSISSILYASALMFVAYTGYGRIATLGEEVSNPKRTIPRAIILAMLVIVILYLTVSVTAIQILGVEAFGQTIGRTVAPLMVVAESLSTSYIGIIITVAAITAMLGVLINLLLGLSRVILAMARRRDVPAGLAHINSTSQSPVFAVWTTGAIIGLLVLTGDIVFTWSFSAFTVLVYYAITNLAALQLPEKDRLYPRIFSILGLLGCVFLAFFIDPKIWILGLLFVVIGLIWHKISLKLRVF